MVIPRTYGRMGNFLFQAATAMSYAWKHQLEFTLPSSTDDPKWNPIYLPHLVNPAYVENLPAMIVREQNFTFTPIPFRGSWRNTNIFLDGYWQNEKYFADHRFGIITKFNFPWKRSEFVSIHVRRGDYLTIIKNGTYKHPPITKEWMEKQMEKFPGAKFMFFSDEIAWCRAEFGQRADCFFSEGKNEQEDLIAMSGCRAHICSASTFSWWGAWLNREPERVIMPVHWLAPGWGGIDTSDIVPKRWERA